MPALPGLLAAHAGRALVVLASGDPTFYGIGPRRSPLEPDGVPCCRSPSSLRAGVRAPGLGRAGRRGGHAGRPAAGGAPRRRWPARRRLLVLGAGRRRPEVAGRVAHVAGLRRRDDDGAGSARRRRARAGSTARRGLGPPAGRPAGRRRRDCPASRRTRCSGARRACPTTPTTTTGSSPSAEVRALTARRARARCPASCSGTSAAGPGSIAIEWMRTHPRVPGCRRRGATRTARPASRATPRALGVPGLRVVTGRGARRRSAGLATPDAVFVGGGVTVPGLLGRLLGGAAAAAGGWSPTPSPSSARRLLAACTRRARRRRSCGSASSAPSPSAASPAGGPLMPVTQLDRTGRTRSA